MFLRLELFGHYLELGRTEQAEPDDGATIADRQYPMQLPSENVGFRVIGPDSWITDKADDG